MELRTVYFDKPGRENTGAVFGIVRQQAEELGIKTVVVASTSGDTAVKAATALPGLKIIAVTHVAGAKPFAEKRRRGLLRPLPVALHDVGSAHTDLAVLVVRQLAPVPVHDLHIHQRDGQTDGARLAHPAQGIDRGHR